MRERPILMSAPMVRAILAGTKSQTRRILKPPKSGLPTEPGYELICNRADDGYAWGGLVKDDGIGVSAFPLGKLPYGAVGDRLWVREAFAYSVKDPDAANEGYAPETHDIVTRADHEDTGDWDHYDGNGNRSKVKPPWKPGIHMPRWASRLTLEITDVRIERVQDISAEDSLAEGVPRASECGCEVCRHSVQMCPADAGEQIRAYAELWESINGRRPGCSWDANPLVWCVAFRRAAEVTRAA